MTKPVFSWKVESGEGEGTHQKCARLIIADTEELTQPLFDSLWSSSLESLGTPVDLELKPFTRYYWQVQVRSDTGDEAVSLVSFFETGRMDVPFQASWIGCADGPRHPVYAKKVAPHDAVSARLYICGLGLYEARWDGEKIGDEVLTPYCNAYDQWLQYQTYDVTEQVRRGGEIAVTLGNGWYKGRFGFASGPEGKGYYGDSWKLIAEIRIVLPSGEVKVIGTDDTWEKRESNYTFSNIYDGEMRDDTLPSSQKVPATVVDAPKGCLTPRYSLPVRTQKEMPVREIIHTPAGETVLDLGQEITGGFRLKVNAPKGTKIHLQFGEILQGENFYRDNLRSAKAEYVYISGGESVVLEPTFTFYGYRYVKVEGLPEIGKEDFVGLCWWSQMPRLGTLHTGNEKINRLISNTEWGHLDNFLDVPTDCPQRDERMGWTGDAEVFAPTACFLRDTYAFYRKYLHDMALEQKTHGGAVIDVIPGFGHEGISSAWGDATTIIPMRVYDVFGDKRIVEEHYESMCSWVAFLEGLEAHNHGWRRHFHYGDWLALDAQGKRHFGVEDARGATDEDFIASVYFLYSTELTARAAEVLGREADKQRYIDLSLDIRDAISEEYYSPSGRCCIDTQTAHLLTLARDLGPNPERSAQRLAQLIEENGGKLATGFVGTPILAEMLTRIGREDLAWNLLFNEEYPGWLYEVNLGATTIWERWNSVLPDGSISSTGMNSLNHYSYGSIVQWIYERVAGLRSLQAGFRVVQFAPLVDRRLGSLACTYDAPSGKWESSWRYTEDGKLEVRLTVPFGCTAHVTLPLHDSQEEALGTGTYVWTYAVCDN